VLCLTCFFLERLYDERMRFNIPLAVISLLFSACTSTPVVPLKKLPALEGDQMVRFFFASAGGQVEAYLARPPGNGPFPLVILLHGHSFVGRGAAQVSSMARAFAKEGCFASLAISLPGYGLTEVPSGAVEEITRQVVRDGLSAARQLSWVDKQRLVVYGESRGAIVAAALANELEGVRGTVLYSGAYDLATLYQETPSFWVKKILNPNGETNPKFMNLLTESSQWRTPTLILHGEKDRVIPVSQALLLRDRLHAVGTPHKMVLYPDHGHFLPRANIREQSLLFFKETVAHTCPVIRRS
jgi:dipeptidyl aminopeptidase/acylaminoacyl peptidase